jgi:hypothetical protein
MSSGYNSTPSRAISQSKSTDIQQTCEQYLALHDVHNCYFITKEMNAEEQNIFTALHQELPKCFHLDDNQIAAIVAPFRQYQTPKEYTTSTLHELPFWCKLLHLQEAILKLMNERWQGDSSSSNCSFDAYSLTRARCRIFSLGHNREYPCYFQKTKKVRWRPDICLVQLSNEEEATKSMDEDKSRLLAKLNEAAQEKGAGSVSGKAKTKDKLTTPAWGSLGWHHQFSLVIVLVLMLLMLFSTQVSSLSTRQIATLTKAA